MTTSEVFEINRQDAAMAQKDQELASAIGYDITTSACGRKRPFIFVAF